MTDGAPWIQHVLDLHRHDARRILDLAHVIEHISLLVEALSQAGVPVPKQAAQRCAEVLKRRGPTLLWRWCERLPEAIKAREGVRVQLEYLRKRLDLMQYPSYREQGWPIGSGMVESANNVVVQARLKGAGMHWASHHVNSMLALRTATCNHRWDEAWCDGIQEQISKRTATRERRAQERAMGMLTSILVWINHVRPVPVPPCPPAPPPIVRLSEPVATLPGSSRPSAHHPWKRGPSCRPRSSATI